MPNLTSKQAADLAKQYASLSYSTSKFRLENWDKLTEEKRKLLSDQSDKLSKQSDEYVIQATALIMNDVKAELDIIRSITSEIDKTIIKITSVQKVINVFAAALDLGAAIISKVPTDIAKKLESLNKSWSSILKNLKKS